MRLNAERSPAIVTALAPRIGYDAATKLVHQAEDRGVSLVELIDELPDDSAAKSVVGALLAMARPHD